MLEKRDWEGGVVPSVGLLGREGGSVGMSGGGSGGLDGV